MTSIHSIFEETNNPIGKIRQGARQAIHNSVHAKKLETLKTLYRNASRTRVNNTPHALLLSRLGPSRITTITLTLEREDSNRVYIEATQRIRTHVRNAPGRVQQPCGHHSTHKYHLAFPVPLAPRYHARPSAHGTGTPAALQNRAGDNPPSSPPAGRDVQTRVLLSIGKMEVIHCLVVRFGVKPKNLMYRDPLESHRSVVSLSKKGGNDSTTPLSKKCHPRRETCQSKE